MIRTKIEEITRGIWTDIELSIRYGITYGEETITDRILLELSRENYFSLKIIQTPKYLEAQQGTDWEWYVGSHQRGWIRYAIQAKKMNVMSNRFDTLNHKVGAAPNKRSQSNLLRLFSNANGAVPLYCFYNFYPNVDEAAHWSCSRAFEREQFGWTFTPLRNVETAIATRGYRSFDWIHRQAETLPIRCIFSCPDFLDKYKNAKESKNVDSFLGEKYKWIDRLPSELIGALEIGRLKEFPQELYRPEIDIYPKRIAIIDIGELLEKADNTM